MRLVDWIDRGQDQGESRNSQGIAEPEQAIHGALSVDSSAARRSLIDPELMRQLFEVLCIHDFRTGWACQFSLTHFLDGASGPGRAPWVHLGCGLELTSSQPSAKKETYDPRLCSGRTS
jgi:hypothetical protein